MLKNEREEMTRTFEGMKTQLIQELTETKNSNGAVEAIDNPITIIEDKDSGKSNLKSTASSNIKPLQHKDMLPPPQAIPIIVSPMFGRRGSLSKTPSKPSNLLAEKKLIDTLSLELQTGEASSPRSEIGYTDTYMRHSVGEVASVTQVKPIPAGDRLTISQMVEDSLQCPGTMASIRKQLKEDGLTPKLKKKFEKQPKLAAVKETDYKSNMAMPPVTGNHNPSRNGQT